MIDGSQWGTPELLSGCQHSNGVALYCLCVVLNAREDRRSVVNRRNPMGTRTTTSDDAEDTHAITRYYPAEYLFRSSCHVAANMVSSSDSWICSGSRLLPMQRNDNGARDTEMRIFECEAWMRGSKMSKEGGRRGGAGYVQPAKKWLKRRKKRGKCGNAKQTCVDDK